MPSNLLLKKMHSNRLEIIKDLKLFATSIPFVTFQVPNLRLIQKLSDPRVVLKGVEIQVC